MNKVGKMAASIGHDQVWNGLVTAPHRGSEDIKGAYCVDSIQHQLGSLSTFL